MFDFIIVCITAFWPFRYKAMSYVHLDVSRGASFMLPASSTQADGNADEAYHWPFEGRINRQGEYFLEIKLVLGRV